MLFDIDLLKKAWSTRIEKNNEKAESELTTICAELRSRVPLLPDKRSQQIITDTLLWAERNPKKIDYNVSNKDELLSISPNLVGFQFVMSNIGFRLQENKAKNSKIIVDQQSQFNKSQKSLAEFYALIINDRLNHTLLRVLKKQSPLLRSVSFDSAVPSNKTFMCPDGFLGYGYFCGRDT